MTAFETYLGDLLAIRGRGVKETASYGTLANLLNEIGKSLKPKVTCIINIKNRGAGIPDGGFFTADQLRKERDLDAVIETNPARGVMEVKGVGEDVRAIAKSEQVAKYLAKYGQVLVTTYREFVLVVRDENGHPVLLESYSLGATEDEFWQACLHARMTAELHGARLEEFLKRAMLRNAVLDDPKELAWFLASYARDALARVERSDLPALANVREGLEQALGIKFEGARGEHFFRSTLIQTLFYGVFSAWVLWCEKNPDAKERFSWKEAAWSLRVPMIRTLFEQCAQPSKLGPLGLDKLLDLVADTLSRVDRPAFFAKFNQEQAVQYFYEPFLEAFDPALRKDLGVWYTPPEIVEYMVRRVDTALKEELGIADGLADKRVVVLDPCCGTGAFLVGVLKVIRESLEAQGADALSGHDLKQAAMERVFGFEILPAPFVIAHLQLGLLLQHAGAPFSEEKEERAAVYLTNALTGWEPPKEPKTRFLFPEMEAEKDAAERVKREAPILVILGNPPYNAFAGVAASGEEQDLVRPYKAGLIDTWKIKKFNLDDLYVRFFRLAERRIAERTGKGVVCFISNYSYLGDPSFVVMRERFKGGFDKLWFDCLNGDSRETGKLTPEGKPDPSVFSTEQNREGIRVGTAIGLMVRKEAREGKREKAPLVRFRHFWGTEKRAELLASLQAKRFDAAYEKAAPEAANRYSFRPMDILHQYREWPSVDALCAIPPTLGILENRSDSLIDNDREPLKARMQKYYDKTVEWDTLVANGHGLARDFARYDARKTREKVLASESFSEAAIVRLVCRPMDVRWCYYSFTRPLWNECRPQYAEQCWTGNISFMARRKAVASEKSAPFSIASTMGAQHSLYSDAYYFPLRLKASAPKAGKTEQTALAFAASKEAAAPTANLSPAARAYLQALKAPDPDASADAAALLWMHALAIGYAPAYLAENADGIRQDWPRIPLPARLATLRASAELGRTLAALLDTETAVPGLAARPELKSLGRLSKSEGAALNPTTDLCVKAGWGHAGKEGVTMPGKGKLTRRDYTSAERRAIAEGARALGLSEETAFACLGAQTLDVYLNGEVYWQGVPERVWEFTIGGYQVVKKWLSYREESLLGRALSVEEARTVPEMVRRLAAILLIQPALDANYAAAKEETWE